MKKKWIETESNHWVEKEIITEAQRKEILAQYEEQSTPFFLPILASILIGVGILTLVASNWRDFDNMVRLTILMVTMVSFYGAGYMVYERNKQILGSGLIGLGYITLGAGIFLTGQMYQLQAYNANIFVIWAIMGLLLMLFYKDFFFYLLTFSVITAGQLYSLANFSDFNLYLYLLVLLGLGHFTYHRPKYMSNVLFSLTVIWMSAAFILKNEWSIICIYVVLLLFGLLALFIQNKLLQIGIRYVTLLAAVFFTILMVFEAFEQSGDRFFLGAIISWVLVIGLYAFFIYTKKSNTWEDILLFIPYMLIPTFGDITALIVLFVYSIIMLLKGYKTEEKEKVNIGIFLFLLSVTIGYWWVAWTFLSKAMFFFIGGLMLFILSFLLEHKKRQTFRKNEKGAR
ncbi:DUF2157 domain-containing protein [Massilibacterium senegalense]|uniref:DUF2157 domain-containing protein n=1 Tax=Massilibacterium senegalense TaxID=1632858 RepID=UPI000782BECB|nr:DUF2157 domain-containing protein [Massilibacterium senegalense]